ncbi:expressed unknown protein [Seminavis robusta]|uniref:Uncharacterized protein n=1 Tax=Seminavis robusta TaxID=568900 RepID=A0A9N8EPP7_9STRA|nr:expressed unknown protein [Seminavis robusta]|eukprot:Sro1613_g286060.1 n/a (513) ;mRNA; f:20807-22676
MNVGPSYTAQVANLWDPLELFPNNLEAPDRDLALKFLYSSLLEMKRKVFFGFFLDDGVLTTYDEGGLGANYREPGFSGCDPFLPYQQYPLQHVRRSIFINLDGNNIVWCQNYTIRTVQPNQTLGCIPRSYSCIRPNDGQLTQTDTFADGSPVDRVISGPYAQCGGGQVVFCNTTHTGVYRSRNYDHRYRAFYRQARQLQKPLFQIHTPFSRMETLGPPLPGPCTNTTRWPIWKQTTLPFPLKFSRESSWSIISCRKFPHPRRDCRQSRTNRCYCHLREQQMHLAKDDRVTNGRRNATRQYHPKRSFILARGGVPGRRDCHCQKLRQRQTSNAHDEAGAAYAAQSIPFISPNENLEWRIVVASPIEQSTTDTITPGSVAFALVCALGIIGCAVCLAARFRRDSISQSKSILFTLPIIVTQFTILMIFTFVDPSRPTETLELTASEPVQHITFQRGTPAFFITSLIFTGEIGVRWPIRPATSMPISGKLYSSLFKCTTLRSPVPSSSVFPNWST